MYLVPQLRTGSSARMAWPKREPRRHGPDAAHLHQLSRPCGGYPGLAAVIPPLRQPGNRPGSPARDSGSHGDDRSGTPGRPSEAVEDQGEADLELVPEAVAGLEDVVDGQLGEVRVLVRGELAEDVLRDLAGFLGGLERQARLLKGEPVDVAVEQGVGV